jgi:hypothetical protein
LCIDEIRWFCELDDAGGIEIIHIGVVPVDIIGKLLHLRIIQIIIGESTFPHLEL